MILAGIDPGMSGAIAVINSEGDCESCLMPTMGEGKARVVDGGALARFLGDHDVEFVVIEQVASMPRQGVASTFKFGTAFGQVLGVTQALLLPHTFVSPNKWKKAMGLSKDKALSRRRAIERLPLAAKQFERVKDEGRAEAALLALYWMNFAARQKGEGESTQKQLGNSPRPVAGRKSEGDNSPANLELTEAGKEWLACNTGEAA